LGEIVKNYKNPVLVQSIDGVGTKLMIANAMGMHTTIGIDMVAHSCNDILCQGAKPITFLDYIATEKVRPEHIEDILKTLANFYETEVDNSIKIMIAFIEPILLLFIGVLIGTVALAVIVPVYQLVGGV